MDRLYTRTTAFFSIFTLLAAPLAPSQLLYAQDAPASDTANSTAPSETSEKPWLYENAEIPVDKSWTFGVLENGVRYAVKRNGVPPQQVSIRIAVDVGSLHERDSELGFAHLLEHLLFRESKYVNDGEAKRIWQRFGATFGSDTNAHTTTTQTVYKLDLPAITSAKLDESMKILSGMIGFPIFTKEGVDTEKNIVLAEKRESDGPGSQIIKAANELFYFGQRLAIRPIIGTDDTLKAASPAAVSAFHARWYRPENTVVVMAGDMPVAEMEASIKKHFGSWQVSAPKEKAPDFGDPTASDSDVKLFVEPNSPMMIVWTITRPWRKVSDTFEYNQQNLASDLALNVINRRLERQARRGGSFLNASVSRDRVSRSAEVTQIVIYPADNNWQKALHDVRAFVADALDTPPTQEDINREMDVFSNAIQTMVESYPFEAAANAADNIVQAVDIRETVATPDVVRDVFEGGVPSFTPKRMHDATKAMFTGDTSRVLLVSPTMIEGGEPALAAAFEAPVDSAGAIRVVDEGIDFDALPPIGKPGKLVSQEVIGPDGLTRLKFANGVTALLYSNDGEKDSVRVRVRFGKGYQAFSPDKPNLLWSGGLALMASGIGKLGLDQLDELLNGKRVGFSFSIDDDAFEFDGETRPSELDGQLHLFAAKLHKPGWEEAPLERSKRTYEYSWPASNASAGSVLMRDMEEQMYDGDTRFHVPSPDEVNKLSMKDFKRFWTPILRDGPIEVMLFGDFKSDAAIDSLSRTFGALPKRKPMVIASGGDEMHFTAPSDTPVTHYHNGDANQAAAMISWPTGAGTASIREKRVLELLAEIYRDRLFETFRAKEGTSYSPYAYSNWPENMQSGGYFAVYSLIKPENVDTFFNAADAIALDLASNPVSADELQRAVKPRQELIERAATGNSFWMTQLEGMTGAPDERMLVVRSIFTDYGDITPEELQEIAARYLVPGGAWKSQVLPKAQ